MAVDNRNFVSAFANEGGADVLVEDKRMDELKDATPQTSSQISTSAQYIPLQDTDGNLVKINPASFEEAVRNVLGTLLANNDKGTTISAVPALSGSGASLDFGSVSPANLASVLGVNYTGISYSSIQTWTGVYARVSKSLGTFFCYTSPKTSSIIDILICDGNNIQIIKRKVTDGGESISVHADDDYLYFSVPNGHHIKFLTVATANGTINQVNSLPSSAAPITFIE